MKITPELFISWATVQGIYTVFCENRELFKKKYPNVYQELEKIDPLFYVCGSFYYDESPEGEDFWFEINHKWQGYMKDLQKIPYYELHTTPQTVAIAKAPHPYTKNDVELVEKQLKKLHPEIENWVVSRSYIVGQKYVKKLEKIENKK